MGRRGDRGFSKLEIACAVVSAVAAIAGLVVAYKQLHNPPAIRGEIFDAEVDASSAVEVKFELEGLKGKESKLTPTVLDAASRRPIPGLGDQPTATFRADDDKDEDQIVFLVKMPTQPGIYVVEVVLEVSNGKVLDRKLTEPVQVGAQPPPTSDPNAYPNALERALLSHIPGPSKNRCRRANPLNLGDTAGVQCEPAVGASAVWYYQFADVSRLRNAYAASPNRTKISGTGNCNAMTWRGESAYDAGGAVVGRLLCYEGSDGRQWVEWTNEGLLILARANSPDHSVLLDWWITDAGPVR
ncbi:MAG: hypothetical protein ABR540_17220 [Acidimicrobiales bacterium]